MSTATAPPVPAARPPRRRSTALRPEQAAQNKGEARRRRLPLLPALLWLVWFAAVAVTSSVASSAAAP